MQRNEWRDRLISEHTNTARRIALKMARRCPDWIAREDLVSAGLLGLIEAADRYDESRQEPFLSFAEHRIRGAVLDELRRGDLLPRRVRQLARKVTTAIREIENHGEAPSDQRVAEVLGVSVDQYRTGIAHLVNVGLDPIDSSAAVLVADQQMLPDEVVAHREAIAKVREALALLEARDVTILGLYYIEEMTYQQIGEALSVTPSRVCQLLWRALDRLRAQLGEQVMAEAA